MLIIEMAKIELIGGHIENKLIMEMARKEINWIYDKYQYKILVNMLIIDIAKIEINRRPYWI